MSKEVRDNLKYTDTHEWLKLEGENAKVGITDHAQEELTDIVFVELPEKGKKIEKGDELCVVESVKSVSEIYAPVSGEIVEVNEELEDSPELVNKKPYDEGWLVEIKVSDKKEINQLLNSEDYKKNI